MSDIPPLGSVRCWVSGSGQRNARDIRERTDWIQYRNQGVGPSHRGVVATLIPNAANSACGAQRRGGLTEEEVLSNRHAWASSDCTRLNIASTFALELAMLKS
jgi:hypothetical protein